MEENLATFDFELHDVPTRRRDVLGDARQELPSQRNRDARPGRSHRGGNSAHILNLPAEDRRASAFFRSPDAGRAARRGGALLRLSISAQEDQRAVVGARAPAPVVGGSENP